MALDYRFEEITGGDETLAFDPQNLRRVRRFQGIGTLPVSVSGDYFDFVADHAIAWVRQNAPTTYTPLGTLFWNEIQIHEDFYAQYYEISVTYGPLKRETGAYQITVDTSGGTVHVTAGTVIAAYGDNIPADVKDDTTIGHHGDIVEGCDIPVEEPKLSVMFRHPRAKLNRQYIRAIGQLVGFPNNDSFLGYEPGEVLYLGGPFTETSTEATASYQFAISYNRKNFDSANITIGEKKGWDILDPHYCNKVSSDGKGLRPVEYFKIIRPASRQWKDYVSVFGWGGS